MSFHRWITRRIKLKIIENNHKSTVNDINEKIKNDIYNFSGKKQLNDDLTIISIRSKGKNNV